MRLNLFFIALLCLGISTIYARVAQEPVSAIKKPAALPEPTPEELEKALAEIDTFFKNMSDQEMEEFMGFLDDIEKGKIDINEFLPPELQQQPPVAKPQQKPEAKPTVQEIKPEVVEKPKEFKRDFNSAQAMITSLLDRINSLRRKASSMRKVSETLAPLNSSIDTLVYYLHVMQKREHIEQLISDTELLPLHDALRDLNDVLKIQEQKVIIPEFGLEPQSSTEKERSKKALSAIISALNSAFKQRLVISHIEKLFKKYEPEVVKKRKEIEEQEERAKKEAEQMKSWRPSDSRTKRESEYSSGLTGSGRQPGYMDWYYGPDRKSSSYEPSRSSTGAGAGSTFEENKPTGSKKLPGKDKEKEEKESKDKDKTKAKKTEVPLDKELTELADSFDKAYKLLISEIESSAAVDQYFNAPDDLTLMPKVNASLADVADALESIARKRNKLETNIRKLSKAFQANTTQRFNTVLAKAKNNFEPVYRNLLTRLNATKTAVQNNTPNAIPMSDAKLYAHLGYCLLGRQPLPQAIIAAIPIHKNYINQFLNGYDMVFKESAQTIQQRDDAIQLLNNAEQAAQAAGLFCGGTAPKAGAGAAKAGAPKPGTGSAKP